MDEKNKNISDTFGKYNNGGKVQDVSSDAWTPISAGKTASQNRTKGNSSKTDNSNNGKKNNKNSKSKQKKKNDPNVDFISQGPQKDERQRHSASSETKEKPKKNQKSKSPEQNNNSRTPTGKDMRDKTKKDRKYNESLAKNRKDYEKSSADGLNHDEYCQKQNSGKRKKNAVRNIVTVGTVLMFALLFIVVFCYNQGGLIENVEIKGQTIYTDEEIMQAAGIVKGRKMFTLKEEIVRTDITTKLPYIKEVMLERKLPDTVILHVSATKDKYVISSSGTWLTLDASGKVVDASRQTLESGVYRADGFDFQQFSVGDIYKPDESNERRFELLKKIVALLERGGVVDTAVIELKNTDDVRIIYNEKIAVYLGDCQNLEEKIPSASAIIATVAPKKLGGYIDLRYDPPAFKQGSMEIE